MNATERSILRVGVRLAAKIAGGRFVTAAGALPAANGRALGVTYTDGDAGDRVSVMTLGVARVVASSAIAAGASVAATAEGKAATKAGNAVALGTALTAAAADGDEIEVHLIPN